ncbi:MAG TPA: hypothetical protein VK698_23065 [Kofleriaceae bacterium]|nr:hypothetical protein [Kofleriaceae bacterium]
MNRFLATLSVLMMSVALVAGCNKKKEEPKTDPAATAPAGDPAATTPPAGDPAATTPPAGDPAATTPPAGDKPAAAGKYTVDEACDKSIAMMEQMGTAVSTNKGNCDGMGDALQKWADDNKDFIAWGKANDNDPAMKKEFEEKCMPKMTPVMEKIGAAMGGAQECAQNEKVKAALATMN